MSWTSTPPSPNPGAIPTRTSSTPDENTGVVPVPALPDDFGEEGYFQGGTLYQYLPDGSTVQYEILGSEEALSNGTIVIELDEDLDPWPEESYGWAAETSDGALFACEDLDSGTPGSPYAYVFGGFVQMPSALSGATPSWTTSEADDKNAVPDLTIDGPSINAGAVPDLTIDGPSINAGAVPDFTEDEADEKDAIPAGTNSAPSEIETGAPAWSSDTPEQIVLGTEGSPVEGTVAPDTPTSVDHTATLDNSQSWTVWVKSRSAPVTITLPNPAALNQVIQIGDTSGQSQTHPVTVDPNGLPIDGSANPRVYNTDFFFVSFRFDGAGWKIQ